MTGAIQSYIPSTSSGVIRAEDGERLFFMVPPNSIELQGGDLVEFERCGNGEATAINVILRRRWADLLNENHRGLVNQFHNMVHLEA